MAPHTTRHTTQHTPAEPRTRAEVPFLDVAASFHKIRAAVDAALGEILDTGCFAQGQRVAQLEREFAQYCGTRHAIAVASGTDSLAIVLRSLGLQPGDEVITTALSFVATAEAIVLAGGKPIFVDVDAETLQLDPAALESARTDRTVGLLPVHLYGGMADMQRLQAFAEQHALWLIEDACQAHGALYRGARAGSIGTAGCFSFYPGKNLGTCGEGGMIVTNDDALAHAARLLRDHGAEQKYEHVRLGSNARMSEIEAAVLSIKLPHLDAWNAQRRELAALYAAELAGLPLELTRSGQGVEPVHHLFTIRTSDRDGLRRDLAERGVQTGIHYPHPLHVLEAVGGSNDARGDLPIAEGATDTLLSLPMFPELGAERVRAVCAQVRALLEPPAALPTGRA